MVYNGFQSYSILYTNLPYGLYWFPIILHPLYKPSLRFILVSNHTSSFIQTFLTVYIGFQSYSILYTKLPYGLYWFPIILHPLYKPSLRFILVSNHTSSFIRTFLTVYNGFQTYFTLYTNLPYGLYWFPIILHPLYKPFLRFILVSNHTSSFIQTFLTVYIGFQSYSILYMNLPYGLYWFPIILHPLYKPSLRFILVSNHTPSFIQTFLTVYIGFQSYSILYTNLPYGLYWFPIILHPLYKPSLRFILVSNHTPSFIRTFLTVYIGFQSYSILYTNLPYGLYWIPIILHPLYKASLRFILVSNHTPSFIRTFLTVYIGFQSYSILYTNLPYGLYWFPIILHPLYKPVATKCGVKE